MLNPRNHDTTQIHNSSNGSHPHLMDLPTELHMHIASFLSYPDALALKHTSRHFNSFVYTGVYLKINWILERFERKLECPQKERCSFRTDESFCNKTVRKIMERRRRHLECRPGVGGCFVVEGAHCRKEIMPAWVKELRSWKGVRDEVLTFGLLLVFWSLAWYAGKLYVEEDYILNLGLCILGCLMIKQWPVSNILRRARATLHLF